MMSYRHSFHAGNHADVLKHLTQLCLLQRITQKPKPAVYIDTHAGAGRYQLDSAEALKTEEFQSGVGRLKDLQNAPKLVQDYCQLLAPFLEQQQYPGSPEIAMHVMRNDDAVVLMEFHNNEIEVLKNHFRHRNARIHHRDGFEGLVALCPPKPARGLVLIDPPYEVFGEYQQVLKAVTESVKRWAVGTYAVWYPLLSSRAGKKAGQSELLRDSLASLEVKNALSVELEVEANTADAGMYGSGMLILNAPWQTDELLSESLGYIEQSWQALGVPAKTRVKWLKEG